MAIKRTELLTNGLKICENCKWCCYDEKDNKFPVCEIDGQERGLLETCDIFEYKTINKS